MENINNITEKSVQDIYEYAIEQIIKEKKSSRKVVGELVDMGVSEQNAQTIVDNVKGEIRKQKIKKNTTRLIEGVVFLLIGIVATSLSDKYVFTGAIGVGAVLFVIGLFGLFFSLLRK